MKYEDLEKPELLSLIKRLESRKKYGLIWDSEHSREIFPAETQNSFPYLVLQEHIKSSLSETESNQTLIEGDNFFALQILNFTHKESIDVIYIDPPYNTGNKDFKYNDQWIVKDSPYRHSSWLEFMSKRLRLARNLLTKDGVIFISIDDNEFSQLKLLCDQIFGERNFIANFVWEKKRKASNLDGRVRGITEYILAYGKSESRALIHPLDKVEEEKPYPFYNTGNSRGVLEFPAGITFTGLGDGIYKASEYKAKKTLVKLIDPLTIKNGRSVSKFKLEGEWRYSQKWLDSALEKGEEIVFKGKDFKPYWINRDETRSKKIKTLLNYENYQIGTNEDGNEDLFKVIGENDFSFPKPVSLILALLQAACGDQPDAIVLDFFAGSGTTGAAVMKLNSLDGGRRQSILVTNNEGSICQEITTPRLKNLISGFPDALDPDLKGNNSNFIKLKIEFIPSSSTPDENLIRVSESFRDIIKLRHATFEIIKQTDNFEIYGNSKQKIGVYKSFDYSNLIDFENQIRSEGCTKAYLFSFDEENIDLIDSNTIEIFNFPKPYVDLIRKTNVK